MFRLTTFILLTIVLFSATAFADQKPVLFVHGVDSNPLDGSGVDCERYDSAAIDDSFAEYFRDNRDLRTIGWYMWDTNCDLTVPGASGFDSDTSIEVVADALAALIYTEFSSKNIAVDIVAHSLGGLVVRSMIERNGKSLLVEDVVTASTPHDGTDSTLANLCPGLSQCGQALTNSPFLNDLQHNPQSATRTYWHLLGTENDTTIGKDTATVMDQRDTKLPMPYTYEYSYKYVMGVDSCYAPHKRDIGHGEILWNLNVGYCTKHFNAWGIPYWTYHASEKTPAERLLERVNINAGTVFWLPQSPILMSPIENSPKNRRTYRYLEI